MNERKKTLKREGRSLLSKREGDQRMTDVVRKEKKRGGAGRSGRLETTSQRKGSPCDFESLRTREGLN